MISTKANLFGRVITALVTPFNDQGEIDTAALVRLVEHLVNTGSTTLLVGGTTGESPTVSISEKYKILDTVLKTVPKNIKVILGTGSNSTKDTVETTAQAADHGAHGVLIVAPYYNKPNQAGLKAHFSAACESTNLPVILYNIPGRTGVNVEPTTIIELSHLHPNLHALKDSTSTCDQAAQIADAARSDFVIYAGDDYLTLPFLSVGACGVVSVASHIIGKSILEMINSFYDGNLDRARQLHYQYLPLFKGLFAAPNPMCVKHALSFLGLCSNKVRLPLVQLNVSEQKVLEELLISLSIKSPVGVA